ncbi:hypothetical protein N825_14880 [Skermanella stibiiresistens SB22]|uniref:Uncharacterized protein n=1 Tax=Skermanella stibiiresistens SB22 TaxID=1385369 RepID=W9GWM8_9PROT|nr:DUF4169 family protein [Skermanella stibiiresistens]EWY38189.1 hypothetical protein N825_14880 [Skermanella stibiiresistens SB22]
MGDVVNLNRFRKAREKSQKEAQAAANRAKHGRTKDQRATERDEEARRARELEGKKIDDPV